VDYFLIYKEGRKVRSERFVLFGRENGLEHHRLGITASRKTGCAVIRNHIKRLFREIFRKSGDEIPYHLDLVVNARAGCVQAGYHELRAEFIAAARKICR
jgi:ribonuclease P protein component